MSQFRNIDYSKMLYECLRSDFSINSEGNLSVYYRLLLAVLWPLQLSFNQFDAWRRNKLIIAQCNFEIGQLTNVLNYLFDPIDKRIYISQSNISMVYDPTINYSPINFDPIITEDTDIYEPTISDQLVSGLIFNIPAELYSDEQKKAEIISVIEQIRIDGVKYNLNPI